MNTTIKWNLAPIMDRVGIKNKDLAKILNLTPEAVYRMKTASIMPRYSGDQIGAILDALNDLYREKGIPVQILLFDLLEQTNKIQQPRPERDGN